MTCASTLPPSFEELLSSAAEARKRSVARSVGRFLLITAAPLALEFARPVARDAAKESLTYRVRTVEVRGNQLASVAHVRRAAGLVELPTKWRRGFDPSSKIEAHPLIISARVAREPGGLVVIEVEDLGVPVAHLASAPLKPIGSSGRVIPLSPTERFFDLPILWVEGGGEAGALRAVAASDLAFLQNHAPEIFASLSEARAGPKDIALTLDAATTLRYAPPLSPARLSEMTRVLSESLRETGEMPAEVDARFREQVVVRPRR